MLGAIIGDIVGSRFEMGDEKPRDFEWFTPESHFTDDSVLTLALAKSLLESQAFQDFDTIYRKKLIENFKCFVRTYPQAGYGRKFESWALSKDQEGYNSLGNGAAMRISPIAYYAQDLDDLMRLVRISTEITHNHPEAIRGAEATALAVFMALNGACKQDIRRAIEEDYYSLDFSYEDLVKNYGFDSTCQGTVPQAIYIFLISENFRDLINKAISIGGDSDTLTAIAGSIGSAYYGSNPEIEGRALAYLDQELVDIYEEFVKKYDGSGD